MESEQGVLQTPKLSWDERHFLSSSLSGSSELCSLRDPWRCPESSVAAAQHLHKARLQHDLLWLITLTYGIKAGTALFFSCKGFRLHRSGT